ncbi:hypothetical protein P152DRAFT_153642 [Eremomyces bilateralis CBS 781.70]|uniref:Uncharacterized protein n=1 Tax=Eremomyces bilateralis CBS 781.70 TaxID=1392243 RepID=A0A6G1FV18_9PEZI|nr:uncharacterized protein P152DRAFT_153642 [Eremomyces bilateralis CBS 781.70]KAF1809590.1 hypothetical protein P152DRAFT_153642 [Eremomyces bilateralis CBS 781.70]
MDQNMAPVLVHSNAQIEKFINKINKKVTQLKINDLTRGDQDLLRNRLKIVWAEPNDHDGSATKWRKARAHRAYKEIQDESDHLLLVVVLVIAPTEIAKTSFDVVLDYLLRLETYNPYRLQLSAGTKRFFESMAAEQGFASNRRYLSLIQSLFPQSLWSYFSTKRYKADLNRRRTET